jgi:hypothetical protein
MRGRQNEQRARRAAQGVRAPPRCRASPKTTSDRPDCGGRKRPRPEGRSDFAGLAMVRGSRGRRGTGGFEGWKPVKEARDARGN